MSEKSIIEADWGYHQFILDSAEVAFKGNLACGDTATGNVKAGQDGVTTLVPLGWFTDNLTGDGAKLVNVRLFNETKAGWWDNDTVSPLDAGDVFSECYIAGPTTVSADGTGRSKAGRVLAVDALKGVLVQAGLAVTGPSGAAAPSSAHVADRTALAAIAASNRFNGKEVLVDSDGSTWRFAATSTATDATQNLVVTPSAGSGRWIRADRSFALSIPITFATADATDVFTVPAGFTLKPQLAPYWDVTTAWTGGSSSSIGLSSSRSGYDTKGDLISATVAAALTVGVRKGTIGDKVDTVLEFQALFLEAADTIRHDRTVSAFTAGVANVR